ncbi:MAG: HAMP domain-containing sensor histidine kinase [Bacteroidota bacterium]
MKRNILATIVLIALIVLTFIQFRLLIIGARLEKFRFDQKLAVAQQNIKEALNRDNPVSNALIDVLKNKEEANNTAAVADSLSIFLKRELSKANLNPNFSFAITSLNNTSDINFKSTNFKLAQFNFNEYTVPLGNYFISKLFTQKVLHIDVKNLFGYLLIELDYLVVPSVVCLLALLISFWLLINILQKEQKLNLVKNDFINNLTHELKTPAFSISLANKMAKEQLKKGNIEKAANFLQIIENENNKLKNHTEKVLELASLENPKHQLQKEKTDLHLIIREIKNDFSEKMNSKNGTIELLLHAETFILNIDATHFRNVINNLIDNTIKYGKNNLRVRMISKIEKREYHLTIQDNGPGISTADQKYIFDKFFRVTNNDVHNVKGFGLGLNYVKQIVESHGGKIELKSKLGEGATFIISLPI